MSYITADELKETLGMAGESYADDDIALAVAAADQIVDSHCGRTFTVPFAQEGVTGQDPEPETRVFPVRREDRVFIDDLASAEVEVEAEYNGTMTAWDDGYVLAPENGPGPYTELEVAPFSTLALYPNQQKVSVTGIWGWTAVPAVVKQAASLIALRLLKRNREAPFGITGIGGDGVAVRITGSDPDVAQLLSSVTRPVRLS